MKNNEEICKKVENLLIDRVSNDGGCGVIFKLGKRFASVIWSTGGGWDHVSICPYKHSYTPSWDDMCKLKDMFFHDEEVVVQFHPSKSEYVNNMNNCLHLWCCTQIAMPTPPSIMVGIKDGQNQQEIAKSIAKVIINTYDKN